MKFAIVFCVLCLFVTIASSRRNVCYWGTWAHYRQNPEGRFNVEDIDPTLCSHIIYSFMAATADGTIKLYDEWLDVGLKYISKFVALRSRSPSTKFMYSVGGWNAGSQVFSQIASSPQSRSNFAQNAVSFARKYGFDGFDLDWEYPGQRDGNPSIDKQNFVLLLAELHRVLGQNGLLLTIAVGAAKPTAIHSYDIPQVAANVDFVNLMTYDFHGTWDTATGLNTPMYPSPHDSNRDMNVDVTVQYWISQGAPRDKLVLGIGAYGRSFTLANPANNGVGAPINGGGAPGPFTGQAGILGYNEICLDVTRNGWTRVWEPTQMCPYAFRGNQWVGYDDEQSTQVKLDYIVKNNLGGSMWWSIDTEDHANLCGKGRYPLITLAKNKMMEMRKRKIVEENEIDLMVVVKEVKYDWED